MRFPAHRVTPGVWLLLAVLGAAPVACGKKGPPVAPVRPQPSRIADLTARRAGDEVHLQFTVPAQNADGSRPADIGRVEIHGLTGALVDALGRPLSRDEFERRATLVDVVAVRPPAVEGMPPLERPGVDQGAQAIVVERLTPDRFAPAATNERPTPRDDRAGDEPSRLPTVLLPNPRAGRAATRSYIAVPSTRRGRPGAASAPATVSLAPAPPAPLAPILTYSETAMTIEWEAAPGARVPIQAARQRDMLAARLLPYYPDAHRYNVYEVGAQSPPGLPQPLNRAPLLEPSHVDPRIVFGVERCYVVRTVEPISPQLQVESESSEPACLVPVDIFPPPAPTGLAAVGSQGAISLIWDPSGADDLDGYLVLRADAPGERLQPLFDRPIRETTWRDTDVRPGVRYVYAVVALDTAGNISEESNRVEESARD